MRKFLSLVLALAMTMSLVVVSSSAKEFTDDDELNYEEAVAVISEIGVVDGYADGSFNPQGGLTRGAAAKIICNLILGPTTAAELHADTRPFPDVAIDSEFAGYIAYCAQQGIISGYADGEFKAANPLTGYAFMKMLLGALGYDTEIEKYVGENWSINVAKQAIGIGLNKGLVDEFNGVDYVTREEAALYAFNTLKATLVDYENKISANVNGAEVVISNNTAKPVDWSEGRNEDGNIKPDGFVQFAEEFFPDLVRRDDSTKFEEPANNWVYHKVDIGTFERKDLIVETYTTGVSGRDLYDLLKPGVIKDNELAVYVDGVDATGDGSYVDGFGVTIDEFDTEDLVRSHTDDLGATGNGVLTKVYLDTDKELITIVSIHTWLAKATADYSESKEYAPLSVYTNWNDAKKTYNVDVVEVENVVDVTADTFYQVNISWKDEDNGEVVIINDVEILEDSTVSKFSASDEGKDTSGTNRYVTKVTTGGEEYKRNVRAYYDDEVLDTYNETLLTDNTYNVYLDQYGYFLGVDLFEGTKNYVFITGFDRNISNLSVKTATATGIFLDGTMENIQVNVTGTDKNIEKANNVTDANLRHNAEYFVEWSENDEDVWAAKGKQFVDGVYNLNQWYTYTVDDAGVYTLKPCVRMTWTQYGKGDTNAVIRTDSLSLKDAAPVAALGNGTRVYGEDATVFLTVDLDVVDTTNTQKKAITEVTGVYTGVQNVDIDIDVTDQRAIAEGQVYTVYDSDWYVIGAVVIGEARGSTANYAYIVSGAKSEEYRDGMYYWTFDAILGGEKVELEARSKYENTIDELTKGTVQELRFDGDYVVSIKDIEEDDIYKDYRYEIDGEDVYEMRDTLTTNTAGTAKGICDDPDTLVLQGRTLYVTAAKNDVGLGLASGAKAVTIQTENNEANVVTEFSDVNSAIAHLADAEPLTDGFQYDGRIYAVLNSNATAEWIVFVNNKALTTGSQTGGSQGGSGQPYTANYYVTEWGQVYASLQYNRPAYVPATATVGYSFQVYADNVWIGTATGNLTGNAAQWNGFAKPGANIQLRDVTFTPHETYVKYYINGQEVKVGASEDLTVGVSTLKTVAGATNASGVVTAQGGSFTVNSTTWEDTGTASTYTVTGLVDSTGAAANKSGTTTIAGTTYADGSTTNVYSAGTGYVEVRIIDLDKRMVQYTVTSDGSADLFASGTGLEISNLNDKNGNPNTGNTDTLTMTLAGATLGTPVNATPVTNVSFSVSVDDVAFAGVYAYEVSAKIGSKTYTATLTATQKSATLVTMGLTESLVVNKGNVTVTPILETALTGAEYDAETRALTMTFSNPIDAETATYENLISAGDVALDKSRDPVVAGNTVTVYLLNDAANGDVVTPKASLTSNIGNPFDAAKKVEFDNSTGTMVAKVVTV